MQFDTAIASPHASSYATIEEADSHLADRDGFDTSSWGELAENQKRSRLILAAMIIDSLAYRGVKSTKMQSLQFPRLLPGDSLHVEDSYGTAMPFTDWESLLEYAALKDTPPPGIPYEVKLAQIEVAFQVVHSHLLTLEPLDGGEASITSLGIDVISLSFGQARKTVYDLFSKEQFGAGTPIKLYLQKYLTPLRGALI